MPGEGHQAKAISLFYSYSHKDEDLRLKLQDHLAALKWSGMIAEWNDRDIEAGKEWEREIDHHLSSADIILLLVSASFIASPYCWSVEIRKALERHERGEARVIPVILRPCRWQRTPFAKYQATPKDARPVTDWPDEHAAFDDVVSKIEAVVDEMHRNRDGGDGGRGGGLLAASSTIADFTVFRDIEAPWCPEMVALPAGEYLMGSPESEEGGRDSEGPQHRVTIAYRFAIGRTPVTFAEYDHFCDITKREKPQDEGWGRGRRPVINVSWWDAVAYCEWLAEATGEAYRLPSEAEWEYACRAGTTTRYAFGNNITKKAANFGKNVGKTTEVGSYPANLWGLHDMHGNVWEWCADLWHDNYADAPADGSAWIRGPGGPAADRVIRGGSWYGGAASVRSAFRYGHVPLNLLVSLSFRCARVQS